MITATGRKALGYLEERGGGRTVREADTFTCQHCNRIGIVQPFRGAEESGSGAMCYGCGGLICLGCLKASRQNDVPRCDHIERKLERQERAARFNRELEAATRR